MVVLAKMSDHSLRLRPVAKTYRWLVGLGSLLPSQESLVLTF